MKPTLTYSNSNGQPLDADHELIRLAELCVFLTDRLKISFLVENFWEVVFNYEKNKEPYNSSNNKSYFSFSDEFSGHFYDDQGYSSSKPPQKLEPQQFPYQGKEQSCSFCWELYFGESQWLQKFSLGVKKEPNEEIFIILRLY